MTRRIPARPAAIAAALGAALAISAAPAAAATVQPSYQSASTGWVENSGNTALWQFGTIWDGRPWGDRQHGHSWVSLTGSDACERVAAGTECLVGTIDYFNAVNLGAGTGNTDTAQARMTHAGLGLSLALTLAVDRTRNRTCAEMRYGCPDLFTATLAAPTDGFRVQGNGAWVQEDRAHQMQIFWMRPAALSVTPPAPPPPVAIPVVPLPASGLMLGAAALASVAVARRKRRAR